ncbi:MAD2L1-binding protein isoform X1 [Cynoglossus semilaevis]|uniref:MAD2L1 binding protein n=1 Tax=Cynoglossus semilaevis TaxID=244447 RepID=A0A3P8VMW7_CYNSE|nr:MAD2L1-binding protein isoform X1 [Cynoglossus semilaevis]
MSSVLKVRDRATFPMMHCIKQPAGTFKVMAELSDAFSPISQIEDMETTFTNNGVDNGLQTKSLLTSKGNESSVQEPMVTSEVSTVHRVPDAVTSHRTSQEIEERFSPTAVNPCLTVNSITEINAVSTECKSNLKYGCDNNTEDKENITTVLTAIAAETSCPDVNTTPSKHHSNTEDNDAEVVRRAQEQGCVNVIFPGIVTQEGCCRFVSEILKCILYQRQQLPMTYDQLVYSQKKQHTQMQDKDSVRRGPEQTNAGWRKCQQTLQDMEEVLQQLELLFCLSRVPRVLLLMGGSLVLPKELYEINMEGLVLSGGDQSLRVSSCLRQLFRTLFVADLLSDSRSVRLMSTTILVLAHRDCGVGWFRPKLQFKVPTRVQNQMIALSSDPSSFREVRAEESDWQDYVWFQAPVTIKGFSN